jgi:peptidoglycan/LPS O-acetylase OafA/YrhL
MLAAPLMPTLLWLHLRFCTPRKGLPANRISAVPGQTSFLLFLLLWFGVAIAGLIVFTIWQPPMPHAAIIGSIAMVFWVAVFLWRGRQLDRERQKRDELNAAVAVQQWDEGETGE